MSSASPITSSLTSSDMNMIGTLLIEGRRSYPERNLAFFSEPARLLVRSFQTGVTSQEGLRAVLYEYLAPSAAMIQELDRWNDEGGLLPKMAA